MLALFLPRSVYQSLRLTVLLALFLAVLGVQRCTEYQAPHPTCYLTAPVRESGPALLPVALRMPFPAGQWTRILRRHPLDTSRVGGSAHLLRKASPRSRWLPIQPAYLAPLPHRPKQSFLDSLAAAKRHRI